MLHTPAVKDIKFRLHLLCLVFIYYPIFEIISVLCKNGGDKFEYLPNQVPTFPRDV